MNRYHDNNVIISKISAESKIEAECRQMFKRLSELLPNTLSDIESRYRGAEKAGRAKRLALSSDDYEKAIDDIALFREKALKARVEVDTLRMLVQARRSLNSFVKVAREKGIQI